MSFRNEDIDDPSALNKDVKAEAGSLSSTMIVSTARTIVLRLADRQQRYGPWKRETARRPSLDTRQPLRVSPAAWTFLFNSLSTELLMGYSGKSRRVENVYIPLFGLLISSFERLPLFAGVEKGEKGRDR